jgi:hypothetical protein
MWKAANAVISGLLVSASVIVAVVLLGVSLALAFGTPHETASALVGSGLHQTILSTDTNAMIATGEVVHFWTAGQFPPKIILMLQLLRVMFPYMMLVCLTAVMMGMLNARGHFFIPAMGATMLNVVMIVSVYWLAPRFGVGLPKEGKGSRCRFSRWPTACSRRAWRRRRFRCRRSGATASAMPGFHRGKMKPCCAWCARWFPAPSAWRRSSSTWRWCKARGVVRRHRHCSTLVQYGAVRLMELPQGMFGISLATFLLPTLSRSGGGQKLSGVPRHVEARPQRR